MSRARRTVAVQPEQVVLGAAHDDASTATGGDIRLTPGVSVGGEPAWILGGDRSTHVAQIRCACGALVGAVFWHTARRGHPPFGVVETQVPDRAHGGQMRKVSRFVDDPNGTFAACPDHGLRQLPCADLLRFTRKSVKAIAEGRTRVSRYVLPRTAM